MSEFSDSRSPEEKVRNRSINEFYKSLFQTKILSDIQFTVGDKVIKSHRLVLMSISPFFNVMFSPESKFEESTSGKIEITDFDYEVVLQMLEFVYTGTASKLPDMAEELMRIADKYDLKGLLSKCSKHMIPKICVENALDILVLANETNAENLEDAALTFIKMHYENIRCKNEWTVFWKNHIALHEKITDICASYTPPKRKKF